MSRRRLAMGRYDALLKHAPVIEALSELEGYTSVFFSTARIMEVSVCGE